MKNTITQKNNWKIHQVVDKGNENERVQSLDTIFLENIEGLTPEDCLQLCLEEVDKRHPNINIAIEIGTLKNNEIVEFNY